jgi:hypothetical protein
VQRKFSRANKDSGDSERNLDSDSVDVNRNCNERATDSDQNSCSAPRRSVNSDEDADRNSHARFWWQCDLGDTEFYQYVDTAD